MKVETKKLDKTLEMSFCILAMIASVMLSNKVYEAWILYTISSVIGVVWAYRAKFWWAVTMNTFFIFVNIMGTYNYLIK